MSEYNLKPDDELQFGLTNTPQLVLLRLKEMKKNMVMEPSQVRKLIIADQT